MMVQKLQKIKKDLNIELKLPQIYGRRHVQSAKKNQVATPDLPRINRKSKGKNALSNKENNSLQIIDLRNSIGEKIKERLYQIKMAEKVVKNVLGGPESTINIGGDLTNFQLKVEANKKILRGQRLRSDLQVKSPNPLSKQKMEFLTSPKNKSVSSRNITRQKSEAQSIKQQMMLRIHQFHESESDRSIKNKANSQGQKANKFDFKTQRTRINHDNLPKDQSSEVFKFIKEILSDPQKKVGVEPKKLTKKGKYTIKQLQNRLKEMNQIEGNKSYVEGIDRKNQSDSIGRKLSTAKSVGVIPFSTSSSVNWNKVQISGRNQDNGQDNIKIIKYRRSNFNTEVDQIQKLEMKSHKSIEKMIENRKLLIDLQLMKKNKSP